MRMMAVKTARAGSGTTAAVSHRRPRKTRAERNAENRLALMHAAAEVVGEFGYQEASIARIIDKAGLSNGTFYIHFSSRQDILDQLLPFVGEEIFQFLRGKVSGARTYLELEERALRGYFEYVLAHPSYFRVLKEAEVFASDAYRIHIESALDHFTASLKRSLESGELDAWRPEDLPALARVLLGAREQLCEILLATPKKERRTVVDGLVDTYMRLVTHGLQPRQSN